MYYILCIYMCVYIYIYTYIYIYIYMNIYIGGKVWARLGEQDATSRLGAPVFVRDPNELPNPVFMRNTHGSRFHQRHGRHSIEISKFRSHMCFNMCDNAPVTPGRRPCDPRAGGGCGRLWAVMGGCRCPTGAFVAAAGSITV